MTHREARFARRNGSRTAAPYRLEHQEYQECRQHVCRDNQRENRNPRFRTIVHRLPIGVASLEQLVGTLSGMKRCVSAVHINENGAARHMSGSSTIGIELSRRAALPRTDCYSARCWRRFLSDTFPLTCGIHLQEREEVASCQATWHRPCRTQAHRSAPKCYATKRSLISSIKWLRLGL